ncbi:MAG: zf-HC2 domain-containing protein, partial [Ruminococcus sp.]
MSKNCDIVKDLIPLYIDNVASEESKNLVETHCDTCEECKKFLSLSKETIIAKEKNKEKMDKVWHSIKRNNQKNNIIHAVIILAVVIATILLVLGGKVLLESMLPSENCIEEHFGKEKYAELGMVYSPNDKRELEPVMKEIDKAMNYFGTEKEA